jgi:hypothetical protein
VWCVVSKQWWLLIVVFIVLGGAAMGADGGLTVRIDKLADAFAFAEGFYVNGSRPQRNNNPGDLTRALGFPTIGMDDMYVIFATVTDGWNALKKLIELMLTNQSTIYTSNMTIYEVAQYYTTTQQTEWATNVALRLGVSPFTKISEV